MLVVVPTPDVAERTFADLTYYLGDARGVALVRPREDNVGAIESPSERSARMTLLADLVAGKPIVAVSPVAALRQYVLPPDIFRAATFAVGVGDEPGWEALQERLYRIGYRRTDVVAAAGEFAVRGGIIDVYAATADAPARLEFFGDAIESIRPFDLMTQRSVEGAPERDAPLQIAPWTEISRDPALRERVAAGVRGPAALLSAVRAYLAGGGELPEAWLSLAYESRATLLDYLSPNALVVLEEPAMLATVERSLAEERSREERVLLADVESGELSVDADAVGEALLAEVAAPSPSLDDLGPSLRARRVLVVPGGDRGRRPRVAPRGCSTHSRSKRCRPTASIARSRSSWSPSRPGLDSARPSRS